jgi:hypothetical protein
MLILILIAASDLILILINYFRKLQLPISVCSALETLVIEKIKRPSFRLVFEILLVEDFSGSGSSIFSFH